MEEIANVRRRTQKTKQLMADKRAMELQMMHPQLFAHDPSLEPTDPYGTPQGTKMEGSGMMRQGAKDREDERLAMEVMGVKDKVKKIRGRGGGPTAFQPQGLQVSHAQASAGPGAVPAQAMGVAPQAPASFKRNAVGMGKKMLGEDMKGTYKGGACGECSGASNGRMVGGARAMRGAAIAKLMKEKGLKLGEASRMLKEMSK